MSKARRTIHVDHAERTGGYHLRVTRIGETMLLEVDTPSGSANIRVNEHELLDAVQTR